MAIFLTLIRNPLIAAAAAFALAWVASGTWSRQKALAEARAEVQLSIERAKVFDKGAQADAAVRAGADRALNAEAEAERQQRINEYALLIHSYKDNACKLDARDVGAADGASGDSVREGALPAVGPVAPVRR